MTDIIIKLGNKLNLFWSVSILKTLLFNFHYLPFNQAIRLPVILFKVNILTLKGSVKIESDKIKTGMIQLGRDSVGVYRNTNRGFSWENKGGECIFKGKVFIGGGSAISIGRSGKLSFGNDFVATSTCRIICYLEVTFGNHVRSAWETIYLDTDFHETINLETNKRSNPLKSIIIGNNNWIGIKTMILKGAKTPNYTIIAANSILGKDFSEIPEKSLLAGLPLTVKKTNIVRDLNSIVK